MFKQYPPYKFILAGCDYVLLLAAWAAAIYIRFWDVPLLDLLSRPLVRTQGALIVVYSLVWIIIFQHFNLYKLNLFMAFGEQLIAIVKSLLYGLIGLVLITFIFKRLDFVDSRAVIAIFVVTSSLAIFTFRILIFRRLFALASEKKILHRKVLIVGKDRTAKMVAAQIAFDSSHGFDVVGFVNDELPVGERVFEDIHNVGTLTELPKLVRQMDIDEVIIAESDVTHQSLLEIIDRAQESKANVRLVSDLYNIIPEKVLLEKYLGIPIVQMPQNNENALFNVYKRVFDVVLTLIGMLLLAIPFAVIALLIKLTSKGPVLYKHTRIGKDCKPFEFYKFRTMYVGTDDTAHREFVQDFIKSEGENGDKAVRKITNDPRVTPVGRILRKTSLDELPQLINVLRGEMSLVGPRPFVIHEDAMIGGWARRRLDLTPGITGLWQVLGRNDIDFQEMVKLDYLYVTGWSLWNDVKILLRTVTYVVSRQSV
jgi:undecaprenyl-phosphate galactose phosphotransferase